MTLKGCDCCGIGLPLGWRSPPTRTWHRFQVQRRREICEVRADHMITVERTGAEASAGSQQIHHRTAHFSDSAAQQLAQELRQRIQGEVRFDNGSRALYSTD